MAVQFLLASVSSGRAKNLWDLDKSSSGECHSVKYCACAVGIGQVVLLGSVKKM